jgi:cell division protein FtsZ
MKMREVNEAASYIQQQAHEDANIIFGATIDEQMGDALKVTVIATGFDRDEMQPSIEITQDSASLAQVMAEPIQLGRRSSSRPAVEPASTRRVAARQSVERHHDADISSRAFTEPATVSAGRDRAPNLFSGNDVDWDTPAYQRRAR